MKSTRKFRNVTEGKEQRETGGRKFRPAAKPGVLKFRSDPALQAESRMLARGLSERDRKGRPLCLSKKRPRPAACNVIYHSSYFITSGHGDCYSVPEYLVASCI
jgi:hypothetical protein